MKFRAGIALIWTLLVTVAHASEYNSRPYPRIYVCADDHELASTIERALPEPFIVLDGRREMAPTDGTETTLVYVGREVGAAYECAVNFPGATHFLPTVLRQAADDRVPFDSRYAPTVQSIQWDYKSGEFQKWFIAVCLLPEGRTCPTDDAVSLLVEMAAEDAPLTATERHNGTG